MGLGRALADAGIHGEVLEDFLDQILIALLKRLADTEGRVQIPLAEVDATGGSVVLFSVADRIFHFEVRKKQ